MDATVTGAGGAGGVSITGGSATAAVGAIFSDSAVVGAAMGAGSARAIAAGLLSLFSLIAGEGLLSLAAGAGSRTAAGASGTGGEAGATGGSTARGSSRSIASVGGVSGCRLNTVAGGG